MFIAHAYAKKLSVLSVLSTVSVLRDEYHLWSLYSRMFMDFSTSNKNKILDAQLAPSWLWTAACTYPGG